MQLPGNRWAASRGVYTEIGHAVEHYNKRPNFFNADKVDYLNMEKGVISESIGLYRAYRMPQVIRTVKDGKVEFWARGHADEVKELLDMIPAVGKSTRWDTGQSANGQLKNARKITASGTRNTG